VSVSETILRVQRIKFIFLNQEGLVKSSQATESIMSNMFGQEMNEFSLFGLIPLKFEQGLYRFEIQIPIFVIEIQTRPRRTSKSGRTGPNHNSIWIPSEFPYIPFIRNENRNIYHYNCSAQQHIKWWPSQSQGSWPDSIQLLLQP